MLNITFYVIGYAIGVGLVLLLLLICYVNFMRSIKKVEDTEDK